MLLLGVVTENFKSYTVVESEESVEADGTLKRVESREIVTYGVATNAFNGLDMFEGAIPAGNLNAAELSSGAGFESQEGRSGA